MESMDNRYILAEDVALRSWTDHPYAWQRRHARSARSLSAGEFWLALACDGTRPLTEAERSSSAFDALVQKGVIVPAEPKPDGTAPELSPWQRLRVCPNHYMPIAKLNITGRCNCNCRHCFMASENSPHLGEMTHDQLAKLLDEFEAAGFQRITITGGEPLLHPDFLWFVEEIISRGMVIDHIDTNAILLTREMLEEWKALMAGHPGDPLPQFRVSFDGIDHHDWLRRRKGAEAEALERIALLLEEGFPVEAHVNIWRENLDTFYETCLMLSRMGVQSAFVMRTSELPQWEANADGASSLSVDEYLAASLDFATRWMRTDEPMAVNLWQVATLNAARGIYHKSRFEGDPAMKGYDQPLCGQWSREFCVNYDGEATPCSPCSTYLVSHGVRLGNVFESPVSQIMDDSPYAVLARGTVADLVERNPECAACEHVLSCVGGCRAIACLFSKGDLNLYACDRIRCRYFKEGGEDAIDRAMAEVSRETGRKIQTMGPDGQLHPAEEILAARA